jgi:hypothetical protein
MKRHEERNEKLRTMPYSLRNTNTNKPLPNSTLNPEINSLSPSLKSTGERPTSATTQINHNGNTNKDKEKHTHCKPSASTWRLKTIKERQIS